MGTKGIIKPMI